MQAIPVTQGQTLADLFPAGVDAQENFLPLPGRTITSVVREANLNGSSWTATLTGVMPFDGEVAAARVRVEDSLGAVAYFPSPSGSQVVVQALPVPSITTAPTITTSPVRAEQPVGRQNGVWQGAPIAPIGITLSVTRQWLAGATYQTAAVIGTGATVTPALGLVGQNLWSREQARFVLGAVEGALSAWSVSAPSEIQAALATTWEWSDGQTLRWSDDEPVEMEAA